MIQAQVPQARVARVKVQLIPFSLELPSAPEFCCHDILLFRQSLRSIARLFDHNISSGTAFLYSGACAQLNVLD
jgi:hypothetical protein